MWRQLYDFIFPPSRAVLTLRAYTHLPLTDFYKPLTVKGVITLTQYQFPYIKACITTGKFEHNIQALRLLSELLTHHLTAEKPQRRIIVPIPLHRTRQYERGYNQVTEILKSSLKGNNSLGEIKYLLKRNRATEAQSHLDRTKRIHNLKDAFVYVPQKTINWSQVDEVLLIDDVTTTGTTLEVAKQALLPHLPKSVTLRLLAIAR